MENIKKYQEEILKLDSEWDRLFKELKNGYISKFGFLMPGTPLSTFGLDKYYENYENKIAQLNNKIKNEYIKSLSSIANSIAVENKKLPLLDYNIPFKFIEDSENRIYPTREEKIIFYFLTKPVNTFQELQNLILLEPGFFNQADAIMVKGKAPYQSTIKVAKSNLQYYNIYDKKGNITIVGKGVKAIFKKLLPNDKRMLNNINEKFELYQLLSLISDFRRINNIEDWLIKLDGLSSLESNLKLIKDTYEKLK